MVDLDELDELDKLERMISHGAASVVVIDRDNLAAMIAEIRELRGENARLREALECIGDEDKQLFAFEVMEIARAALTGEPQ